MGIKLGLQLWNQVFDWPEALRAARRAEELGYDHLWSWEHLLAVMGASDQDTFDAYTLLAAWSQVTSNVRLGVLTSANTFRNPGVSGEDGHHARPCLGRPGDPGDRGWLVRAGAHRFRPRVWCWLRRQARVAGRTVARYADMWNWVATEDLDRMRHKEAVLRQRCEEVGRDHTEIERTAFLSPVVRETEEEAMRFFRTQMKANRLDDDVLDDPDIYVTTQERIIELMISWKELGFSTFIVESAAPFDDETAERFATQIRPIVDAA